MTAGPSPWDLSHQPPVNVSLTEAYERGRAAGWREGYAAAQRDRAADPEVIDQAIIDRVTGLLAMLRKAAP